MPDNQFVALPTNVAVLQACSSWLGAKKRRNVVLRSILLGAALTALFVMPVASASQPDQPLFAEDDGIWVLFYDLSSRRFRSARDAFIRRDFEAARRDLLTSTGHLRLEAARADDELGGALARVADRIEDVASRLSEPGITVSDLDASFVRAHWLLAQQYVDWAERARDAEQHVDAGRYLWATAHHLERTVLWSDARVGKTLEDSLDGMRTMASELRSSKSPTRVYRRKPIVQARATLVDLGKRLQLKVYDAAAAN